MTKSKMSDLGICEDEYDVVEAVPEDSSKTQEGLEIYQIILKKYTYDKINKN